MEEQLHDSESMLSAVVADAVVAMARTMIPKGPTSVHCQDCGDTIPEARRQAQPGCKYCIDCQVFYDKKPVVVGLGSSV